MNKIDTNNLDEWLFDYFEGNLTESNQDELTNFLDKNPSSKIDYNTWENSYIKDEDMVYSGVKSLLQKKGLSKVYYIWGIGSLPLIGLFVFYLFFQPTTNIKTTKPNSIEKLTISKTKTEAILTKKEQNVQSFNNNIKDKSAKQSLTVIKKSITKSSNYQKENEDKSTSILMVKEKVNTKLAYPIEKEIDYVHNNSQEASKPKVNSLDTKVDEGLHYSVPETNNENILKNKPVLKVLNNNSLSDSKSHSDKKEKSRKRTNKNGKSKKRSRKVNNTSQTNGKKNPIIKLKDFGF